jgi:Ca-activated chloride channel family protein
MTFVNPGFLWLLGLLPVLAVLRARRGKRAAVRYSSVALAREAARDARSRFGSFLVAARLLSAAAFIVALARPQIADAKTRSEASGVDMVLAVDVSSSMDALDMQEQDRTVDRLHAVKSVVQTFIQERPNDRIGLVAFAGAPYLVSPPTLDHDWLLGNLARLQTGMVQDGTAIGSALAASTNRLRGQDAKAAAAQGVKVHTIGVGAAGEALLPLTDEHGRRRLVKTQVDVDEPTLRKIAEATGGRYFRATDTDGLQRVYAEIDAMEKTTRTIDHRVTRHERFQWPVLFGLSVLGADLLGAFALRRRLP